MNPIAVGRNIAKYRKANELTQAMLADKLGVSNKTISKWECGRGLPDKSMFPLIMETLGITREQLFEGAEITDAPRKKRFRLFAVIAAAGLTAVCVMVVLLVNFLQTPAPPPVSYFDLTLKGATFTVGESGSVTVAAGAPLPEVGLDAQKTFLGWADDGNKFYTSESFAMPGRSTVLSAVYEEDLGDIFTPSCSFEEIATGAPHSATHANLGPVKATVYEFAGGVSTNVGYKILNGYNLRRDSCDNTCPVSAEHGNIVFMTFINNGAEELAIRYEIDFYKVIGSVSFTLGAGEQLRVPLGYGKTPAGFEGQLSSFHQLYFTKTVASKVSLTVYGELYNPDYYEEAQPYELTFAGATYNGAESVRLTFNAKLSPDAEIALTEAGKTFVGWKTGKGKVFVSDEELRAYYKMPPGGDVVTALYAEDMRLFTPSCVYKDKSKDDAEKRRGAHNADGSTTYSFGADVASWLIYNGMDETHAVAGGCPLSVIEQRLYYMSLRNDGAADVTLAIGPEYKGMLDAFAVTIPAGSTVNVSMRLYGVDTPSSFWQIDDLTAAADSQFDLTLKGYYA